MDLSEIIFICSLLCVSLTQAIKCKCTKESETITCYDGVCEAEGGSCLMLDHPSMGVHYTCHNKSLKDGACLFKTSKSGANVRICACNLMDFCNFSYWPEKSTRSIPAESRVAMDHDDPNASTTNSFTTLSFLICILSYIRLL
ncbi:unnamed protein product [Auanema sp. JU1783]|nr:unnamed protein product [Auanema sp. JU1783]